MPLGADNYGYSAESRPRTPAYRGQDSGLTGLRAAAPPPKLGDERNLFMTNLLMAFVEKVKACKRLHYVAGTARGTLYRLRDHSARLCKVSPSEQRSEP